MALIKGGKGHITKNFEPFNIGNVPFRPAHELSTPGTQTPDTLAAISLALHLITPEGLQKETTWSSAARTEALLGADL